MDRGAAAEHVCLYSGRVEVVQLGLQWQTRGGEVEPQLDQISHRCHGRDCGGETWRASSPRRGGENVISCR